MHLCSTLEFVVLVGLAPFFIADCSAGKILVYSPAITASHLISNERIAKALAVAGHSVVMFIPEYETALAGYKMVEHPNIRTFHMKNLSTAYDAFNAEWAHAFGESDLTPAALRFDYEDALQAMCDAILRRRSELEFLREERFDVGFAEQLDTCGLGMLRYMYILAIRIHSHGVEGTTEVFRRHLGRDFPNTGDIAANASLCFVYSDEQPHFNDCFPFDLPRPTIAKLIHIGGLGIEAPRPLEPGLAAIMNKGENGVILMSLGTVAAFHHLPEQTQADVIAVFGRFSDHHFVLKISKEDSSTAAKVSHLSNVELLTWIPQSDTLAHPRLRLFIMHGGLNGLMEAANRAVPVIVIPFFADQFRNGRLVEKRGMGKVLLKKQITTQTLGSAVEQILHDPSYKQSADRISSLLKTRPFSAEERLVKWTEFAISNGVLSHLNVEGARLSSVVYFNLDVFAAVAVALLVMICLMLRMSMFVLSRLSQKKNNKAKMQ